MIRTSRSTLVFVLTALLGIAPTLVAAQTQSGLPQLGSNRVLQSPSPPQKVVIPVAPPNPILINTLPFDANVPGYYQVTQNLAGVAGFNGITVNASPVIIDLNGFELDGSLPGTLTGVVGSLLANEVTVFNGRVLGWGENGIRLPFDCTVINVSAIANKSTGLSLGQRAVAQDCRVTNNVGGILGSDLTVLNSIVSGNMGNGIDCLQSGLLVQGCSVSFNGFLGIIGREPDPNVLGRNVCVVEDCELTNNGVGGMNLPAFSQVRRCVVREQNSGIMVGVSSYVGQCFGTANGCAIQAGAGSQVEGCIVRSNVQQGIVVGPGSSIIDCEVVANQGEGILAGGSVIVRGCNVTENFFGIVVQGNGGGRIENCSVTRNTGVAISLNSNMLVANNDVSDNDGQGILATQDANRIDGNHLARNGVGIAVQGTRNVIVRNSLDTNGVQMQIAADNMEGPFLKTKGFIQSENPWANFDLSFPLGFP